MYKKIAKFLTLAIAVAVSAQANAAAKRGFAIVVDPKSYQEAKNEIENYAKAIEDVNGLKVYIVQDRWGVPDSIRATLKSLHNQKTAPIEGTVLLGDIPVAMIRDAQHMTSAFKMNQNNDRRESSVPSDRYYDDFDLKFKFIGQDDSLKHYFYYSLTADSRQYLRPAIYSGRVRPTDAGGTSRYDKLRAYLRKVVAEKRSHNILDQMLYFNGHGYVSGSVMARIDEKIGLYEHFPWLRQQKNGIGYISHDQQPVTKYLLMNELQRLDLDYAILHHHGAPDTQYFDGLPEVNTPQQAKEFIQAYMRAHLHHAVDEKGKDKDSITAKLTKFFDVPASWLANAYDKEIVKQDSVDDADTDLTIADFAAHGYKPNCRVVMIDACFTGSFHLDDCIADEYIFNPGKTIAVIANSVNVLQDKWSDRYMGLLGLGANVGFIPRFSGYLESQVIGDPTFSFAPAENAPDINALLAANNYKVWAKYLNDERFVDLRSMAIEQYSQAGKISPAELLKIFRTSKSALVRVQALTSLAGTHSNEFIEAVKLGVEDSYELVQRYALNDIAKSGDFRLIPSLIKISISNNTSERCNFSAQNALAMFPEEKLMDEFKRQFDNDSICYLNKADVREKIANAIHASASRWPKNIDEACSDTTSIKHRRLAIRTTRNFTPAYEIPRLIETVKTTKDAEIQQMILESLGWRNYSCKAATIAEFAKKVSEDSSYAPKVREEALKTYNRVK